MVICDIAPMGIRVARAAGVPSVLIESFTWDWIYRGYAVQGLNQFETYLQSIFAEATYRIQTQPICKYADADFTAGSQSKNEKPIEGGPTAAGAVGQLQGGGDHCRRGSQKL